MLVKQLGFNYCQAMVKQIFLWSLACCAADVAIADTIVLKDRASVVGKVLAEKHDLVVVDLGYTVLTVPRSQIVKTARGGKDEPVEPHASWLHPAPGGSMFPRPHNSESVAVPQTLPAFYTAPTRPSVSKTVRELVNQIGESVVQVRTPSGLGSGFIINEDGFLMTNFHVIEGETQISVEVYHQKNGELNRKSYKQVRIIAINKFEDLALLKIEDKDAPKFKYVLMGSADALSVANGSPSVAHSVSSAL
jgi:serine protease Do